MQRRAFIRVVVRGGHFPFPWCSGLLGVHKLLALSRIHVAKWLRWNVELFTIESTYVV